MQTQDLSVHLYHCHRSETYSGVYLGCCMAVHTDGILIAACSRVSVQVFVPQLAGSTLILGVVW